MLRKWQKKYIQSQEQGKMQNDTEVLLGLQQEKEKKVAAETLSQQQEKEKKDVEEKLRQQQEKEKKDAEEILRQQQEKEKKAVEEIQRQEDQKDKEAAEEMQRQAEEKQKRADEEIKNLEEKDNTKNTPECDVDEKKTPEENPGEEQDFNHILGHGIRDYPEIEVDTIKKIFSDCAEFEGTGVQPEKRKVSDFLNDTKVAVKAEFNCLVEKGIKELEEEYKAIQVARIDNIKKEVSASKKQTH